MVEFSWKINKVTRVSIGNMFTLLRDFALIVLTFDFVKKLIIDEAEVQWKILSLVSKSTKIK